MAGDRAARGLRLTTPWRCSGGPRGQPPGVAGLALSVAPGVSRRRLRLGDLLGYLLESLGRFERGATTGSLKTARARVCGFLHNQSQGLTGTATCPGSAAQQPTPDRGAALGLSQLALQLEHPGVVELQGRAGLVRLPCRLGVARSGWTRLDTPCRHVQCSCPALSGAVRPHDHRGTIAAPPPRWRSPRAPSPELP